MFKSFLLGRCKYDVVAGVIKLLRDGTVYPRKTLRKYLVAQFVAESLAACLVAKFSCCERVRHFAGLGFKDLGERESRNCRGRRLRE